MIVNAYFSFKHNFEVVNEILDCIVEIHLFPLNQMQHKSENLRVKGENFKSVDANIFKIMSGKAKIGSIVREYIVECQLVNESNRVAPNVLVVGRHLSIGCE